MLALSLEAHGLWAVSLAYAGSQEREDFVPDSFVMRVTRYGAYEDEGRPEFDRPAELVKAGLWEPIEGGWLIHNHDLRQSDEEARKEANRIRQQRYRDARNASRNAPNNGAVTPVTRLEKSREEQSREETETPPTPSPGVQPVFEAWIESTGKSAKLTNDRYRKVAARLREGFSVDELCDAARGWVNDPWDGRREQNDLAQLMRSGSTVEKFRDLWRNPPQRLGPIAAHAAAASARLALAASS
jgi:hypothetical protein